MATGFLGAGVFPTQLTEKEFESARYDELDDMVNTIGTAMLGMTIGCARCHDHKFDPIPMRDYYRMVTSFATTIRSEIDVDLNPVKSRNILSRWESEHNKISDTLSKWEADNLPARFNQWFENRSDHNKTEFDWVFLDKIDLKSINGAGIELKEDGSLLLKGNNPKDDQWVVTAETAETKITGIRIEAMTDPSMKKSGPGRAENGNFSLSDFRVFAEPLDGSGKRIIVKLVSPKATFEQNKAGLSVSSSIDDNKRTSGWAVDHGGIGKNQAASFEFVSPVIYVSGVKLTLELDFITNSKHTIGRPRFAITSQKKPIVLNGSSMPATLAKLQKMVANVQDLSKLEDAKLSEFVALYLSLIHI